MTVTAVVREGSCPSVQNGRADVREGRYPGGQVSGIQYAYMRKKCSFSAPS